MFVGAGIRLMIGRSVYLLMMQPDLSFRRLLYESCRVLNALMSDEEQCSGLFLSFLAPTEEVIDLRLRTSVCWEVVLEVMFERFKKGRDILVSGGSEIIW